MFGRERLQGSAGSSASATPASLPQQCPNISEYNTWAGVLGLLHHWPSLDEATKLQYAQIATVARYCHREGVIAVIAEPGV
jgi:hypothetical protein